MASWIEHILQIGAQMKMHFDGDIVTLHAHRHHDHNKLHAIMYSENKKYIYITLLFNAYDIQYFNEVYHILLIRYCRKTVSISSDWHMHRKTLIKTEFDIYLLRSQQYQIFSFNTRTDSISSSTYLKIW